MALIKNTVNTNVVFDEDIQRLAKEALAKLDNVVDDSNITYMSSKVVAQEFNPEPRRRSSRTKFRDFESTTSASDNNNLVEIRDTNNEIILFVDKDKKLNVGENVDKSTVAPDVWDMISDFMTNEDREEVSTKVGLIHVCAALKMVESKLDMSEWTEDEHELWQKAQSVFHKVFYL